MTPLNNKKKAKSVTISNSVLDMATAYLSDDPSPQYSNHNRNASHSVPLSTSYSSTISNSSSCSIYASTCTHCGIRELDISCNPIGDEGGVLIGEALKYNTNLRKLDLDNTDIGDDTIISICNSIGSTIPPNTQYEDPVEFPSRAPRIQHTSRLLKLSANKNHIGPKGCEALGQLLEKNPRICSLSLKGNYFGDEGVKKLVRYLKISKPTSNMGSNSHTNSPSLSATMGIPIKKKEHRQSIGSNISSFSSFNSNNGWPLSTSNKSPASTGSNSNSWSIFGIHSLNLSNDGKSPSDSQNNSNNPSSGFPNNSNLLSVQDVNSGSYLDGSPLNINAFNSSSHCKNTHLTSLYLSANNITMKGFIELIQTLPYLKLLDLHNNHICLTEKDDFSTVIKKFGLNKLQELYLSDNTIGVTDLKLICDMLHSGLSPKLEELSLTGNVSLYDDEAYDEWEKRITQLEVERPCLSITWR